MINQHYELAQRYLVQMGALCKRDLPFEDIVAGYKILYKKYTHHKQAIKNNELIENLTGLEARLLMR